jgi:transcriptional regulator with XRE-family HTH domain
MATVGRKKKEPDLTHYSGRLAHRVRGLREAAGMDVERLALRVTQAGYQVAAQTIYGWENGKNSIPVDVLPALAEALGVSIRKLVPIE